MRRIAASALLIPLALAAPAPAASPAEDAARGLESDPVYVHPDARDRLTLSESGRVRLAIVRRAIGRIKVAVMPPSAARRAGRVEPLAQRIDRSIGVHGTLIVVAGPAIHAITSYPRSADAVGALQAAVERHPDSRLVTQLLDAIPRLARVDPGPSADVNRQHAAPGRPVPGRPAPSAVPDGDDFLDDIGDAFRLGVLIVAAAIALPFIVLVVLLLLRVRRARAREEEVRAHGEKSTDDELVELGDEIRALDLDTSMPGANRGALTEYEQAIARYDQANELLEGDLTDYRVQQARAAIAAGRRHIGAARERLG